MQTNNSTKPIWAMAKSLIWAESESLKGVYITDTENIKRYHDHFLQDLDGTYLIADPTSPESWIGPENFKWHEELQFWDFAGGTPNTALIIYKS